MAKQNRRSQRQIRAEQELQKRNQKNREKIYAIAKAANNVIT
jgi:hypothetical protein